MHPWLVIDVHILVSVINTKLRNTQKSLDYICDDEGIDTNLLIKRLNEAGYWYVEETNQFIVDLNKQ